MLSVNFSGQQFLWQEGGNWVDRTTGMHVKKKSGPTQQIKLCPKLIYLSGENCLHLLEGNILR